MMKYKYHSCIFLLIICFIASIYSCNKSDDLVVDDRYRLIKVLDYQINELWYSDYRIAASHDRFYLLFQLELFSGFRTLLLVTDKEGTVIKSDTLPPGVGISDLMVLSDGSLLVAGNFSTTVNLFHYDNNINLISVKSLYVTGIDLLFFHDIPHVGKSLNGNFIVYGSYYNSTDNIPSGYIAEFDLDGNIYWAKKFSSLIRSYTSTVDNGYVFSGFVMDTIGGIDVYLTKINSMGDSLSGKLVKRHVVQGYVSNVIRTTRNTFQLNYEEANPIYISTVHETDNNLDSLNSISLNNTRLGWLTGLSDGSTMLMISPDLFSPGDAVTVRKSTDFVSVGASLDILDRFKFQDYTTDFILSSCITPEGKLACFGVMQSFKNEYYKPVLIQFN